MASTVSVGHEIARLQALLRDPSCASADLANNLGCLLLTQDQLTGALGWLEWATAQNPSQWEFHRNLAEAQRRLGYLDRALSSLHKAYDADPSNVEALQALLDALLSQNLAGQANALLVSFLERTTLDMVSMVVVRNVLNTHRAVSLASSDLLLQWSKLERRLGMPEAAEELLCRVLQVSPDHPQAYRERGLLKAETGHLDEAVACFSRVVQLEPTDWAAWNDAGCCLRAMGQIAQARHWMQRAVAAAPDRATLHANLALIDFELNDYARCDQHVADALAIDERNAEALHTKAMLCSALGRHQEAEELDRKALGILPNYPAARLGLALTMLTMGRLREGFAAYESRWVGSDRAETQKLPTIGRPQWHGQPMLPGATIAVLPEQGFGDQLQFGRFVTDLLEYFHRVIWQIPPELLLLFQSSFASERVQVVGAIDARLAREVDVELPLLSLPFVLRVDLPDLPAKGAYLRPPSHRVRRWRERFAAVKDLKVGVVWQGRPTLSKNALRNCPVALIQTLAMPGVQLVSLQREGDLSGQAWILDWCRECEDFADTAALIGELELVIAVDTAVAHLAGGLGVPVWLLNRFGSEWRWMAGREDSPWYPSMRIFNQEKLNDWTPTIEAVRRHLMATLPRP
jgi:tetratricopeptide (TPR) repeat protein